MVESFNLFGPLDHTMTSNMSTATSIPTAPPHPSYVVKSAPPFEFPKRKRWADLLLTELFDDVAFVLSEDSKILFCGTAITEILGWKDVDLIDLDFFDLVDHVDHSVFRVAFEEAIRTREECTLPIMLKSSSATRQNGTSCKDTVFDIKLYPHIFDGEEHTTCVFAMTAPSPNRDMEILTAMMDLNTENLILQQKVMAAKERLPLEHANTPQTPMPQSGSMYVTSSLNAPKNFSASGAPQRGDYLGGPYHAHGAERKISPDTNDDRNALSYYGARGTVNLYEETEDGSKRKKVKRALTSAEKRVCVTCGRVDSPEWRKGPLGPKTLCNACGLRWAKQMRKVDEPPEGAPAAAGPSDA